jgi:hypothetical protein
MNFSKPFGLAAAETSEVAIEDNIRELVRGGTALRQGENGEAEPSMSGLAILLRRVSTNSSREIDALINELRTLREKLDTDSRRLETDISEYATLSQQVMQLTRVISESVRKLPDAGEPAA